MDLFGRIKYAATLTAVGGALIALIIMILSGNMINVLPSSYIDLIMSPAYLIFIYILAFLIAPKISKILPTTETISQTAEQKEKLENQQFIRSLFVVAIGISLIITLLIAINLFK